MPDTIAALFKDDAQVDAAVSALKSAHFDPAQIQVRRPAEAQQPDLGGHAARSVGIGLAAGTIVGAVLGFLGAGILPGAPELVHGGLFVPFMLAVALGATGGLAGLLLSVSASREDALFYTQEVESGRYLVRVGAERERLESARQILLASGAMEALPADAPQVKRGRRAVE